MVMQANVDVLKSMNQFYHDLVTHDDFHEMLRTVNGDDISTFMSQLDEIR
jgi:hypothetical protein